MEAVENYTSLRATRFWQREKIPDSLFKICPSPAIPRFTRNDKTFFRRTTRLSNRRLSRSMANGRISLRAKWQFF
jgi:hypothetical protein